ncbi:MAG: class I SAM-dependent methyltransferase [Firmicutes bacterium]|nr:class I SAM-dependent methyltransferase [Bacillota bacterium]
MENKENKSSRFWDKRSKVFDEQVLSKYENAYKKTIKRSIPFLNAEDTMLEIGCGTGIATITLADYVKKITAIDISEEMMLQAAEKAKEKGKENITFQQKDLMELCAEPESYDVVAAYNVLLYMKNQDKVLEKIYEILKPGGIFLSATDCLGRNLSKDSVRKFWKSKLHLMPYVSFDTPVGLMRKIQRKGFLVIEIVNLHKNPPNIFIVAQKIEKK